METIAAKAFKYRVGEALGRDVGRAYARLDPADIRAMGAELGDVVEIRGKKTAVAKLMPCFPDDRGQGRMHIDGILRENAGVGLDDLVEVRTVPRVEASLVVLQTAAAPKEGDLAYIARLLDGIPVIEGSKIQLTLFGRRTVDFTVETTSPRGPVLIVSGTKLKTAAKESPGASVTSAPSYEDIGGLKREIQKIREIVELPLRYPEVFDRLGIDAPKGVLLHGPPGCGKTLIARTVARETEASFFAITGPEIIHKFYGESEAHLRKVFDEATRNAPSIVFLDEIDAIAPKRENVVGEVEKRVVAQLLGLMDGLSQRKHLVVIAATNIPNSLDPALRRPGRFDREIAVPIPDKAGRLSILEIHSRGMPLSPEVDLGRIAEITHGFVGADLAAVCREAAMKSLRRIMPEIDFAMKSIPYEDLMSLEVQMGDFLDGLRDVSPSAIREVLVEIPDVHWDDVGGLESTKARLREAVEWPLRFEKLFSKACIQPPKGILLVGPPGCGKTLLAKAVARESQVNFISVKGPALLSKYVGESEKAVREVFTKARQAAPCIVLFDEMDAIAPRRTGDGSDSHVSERVLSQILTELDGMEELRGVLVLGTTNRPDMLDRALLRPGRFDVVIEIEPPDEGSRTEIFQVHFRGRPLSPEVDVRALARMTEGFSGAEIEAVCKKAAMNAVREVIESGKAESAVPVIDPRHLASALEEVRRGLERH
ncbi:MAG: CDC48 family AAA ATPase [Planctomycetes bacterium]|nr:CDC48 family AAA ATPase [Planctomycetota bacterium]